MSGIKFKKRSAGQEWLKAKSARDWDTSRVNCFAYGPPGSGKTRFGLSWPNPVYLDTEEGILTLRALIRELGIPDVPVISISSLSQLHAVSKDPEILREAMVDEFEGYDFKSIVVDTVSTASDWELQHIMDVAGRDYNEIQDYKQLALRMRPIFSNFRQSKYNVLFLAHDYEGGVEMKDKKGKTKPPAPPGPMLTGAMRKQAPGLCDFFLYLRQQGRPPQYFAYTQEHPDGYPARVRGVEEYLGPRFQNPTYQHLRDALDKLGSK